MTEKEYNNCIDLYADRLFRFIYKNLKDEELSKDVVQNTYTILWEKHKGVVFDKSKSYIFTVAYNNMIDQIRKQKRVVKMEEFHYETRAAEVEEYTGMKELLDQGLNALPAQQKSVVLLRDYEGYSYQEIADITGLSLEQVKVYIFRARKYLKEFIHKTEGAL